MRTIDVEKLDLNKTNDDNPFKITKILLEVKFADIDFLCKGIVSRELIKYDKVKN